MIAKLKPWRECTSGMKILLVVALSSWVVGMASLLALAGIETSALTQPRQAIGAYQHPHDIKGTIRFFTDWQDQVHSFARPLLFGSGLIFAAASAGYYSIQRRREADRKRASLDRFIAERD